MSKTITTSVAFTDAQNNVLANGVIIFQLNMGAKLISNGQIVNVVKIPFTLTATGLLPGGSIINANDELMPTGTFYVVTIFNSNGLLVRGPENWILLGTTPIDISTITSSSIPDPGLASPVIQNPSAPQTITGQPLTLTSSAPLTVNATASFNGTPSVNLLATGGDTAALYGVNNANLSLTNTPTGATTFTDFRQYCPPTSDPRGNFGCGIYINRWLAGQDETNFFIQSPFNTGVVAYNSGLSSAITSISRASNVVTVNTSTQVSLRPTVGDVNIAGVTGCGTSPNGHFVPTVISATQFTYPQTGPNETCNPNTGTASPAGRATFVLQRNDLNNNVFQAWYIANDPIGDRSDQFAITQLPADTTNGAGRFRITMVNPILNLLGVGNAAALVDWQVLVDGNTRVSGSVISASSYQENSGIVSGIASFGWRTLAAKQTWFSAVGSNANGTCDVVLNATRGTVSNGFYRFLMDGSGQIWVNSSDASAFIPADFLGGVKTGTSLTPETVNTVDVGTAALPYRALWLGTAATNNFKFAPAATAAARTINIPEFLASSTTLAYNPPPVAGTTDLGTTALPFGNLWLGTAATNNFKFQPAATAAARVISMPDPLGAVNMPYVIASGTSTLTSNATLAAVTSQAAITTAATNTLTTDSIEWSYASAPTAGDSLCHVSPYVTAGNVNFVRSNPTAASQNVSALVINWRVIR